MTTLVDYEHLRLARVIEGAAELTHAPDGCALCARLGRKLEGLADQIRAAVEKVNGTPHEHGPKGPPAKDQPKQDPPPEDPPPPPADRAEPPTAGSAR